MYNLQSTLYFLSCFSYGVIKLVGILCTFVVDLVWKIGKNDDGGRWKMEDGLLIFPQRKKRKSPHSSICLYIVYLVKKDIDRHLFGNYPRFFPLLLLFLPSSCFLHTKKSSTNTNTNSQTQYKTI